MPNRTPIRFIVLFLLFSLTLLSACRQNKTTLKPQEQAIVESVYASANIKAAEQYSLFSPVVGILQGHTLQEGDSVNAGQVIARIENTNPGLTAENARLARELARKNLGTLDELSAQISTMRRQVQLDSLNLQRQTALWKSEVGTRTQLEKAQLAYEASANQLKALQTRYRQTYLQLQTALEQAENQYDIASKISSDYELTSKINGRVYALNYEPGELVNQQKAVATIGRSGQFVIELQVDEVDIARVKTGQKTLISMDAYPGKVFQARVTRIIPNLDTRTQTFRVEAEFVEAPAALYPGLSAEANIVVQEKPRVLTIPLNYLKTPGSVMTEKGEVKVVTGLKSLDRVEIISGLDLNTEIIKP